MDVESSSSEQRRDPRQHARLVLHDDREGVIHGKSLAGEITFSVGPKITSSLEPPAGTIGKTISSRSTTTSTTTGLSSIDKAFSRVGPNSSGILGSEPNATKRFRQLGVVDAVAEEGSREAAVVEESLPLLDHAVDAVVEHGDLHRDLLGGRGDELVERHLKAAVTIEGEDQLVRSAGLGTDRGGNGEIPSFRAHPS